MFRIACGDAEAPVVINTLQVRQITDFYQDSGTTIATLEYAKGGIGPITLVFNNQPFELRQWKIVDPQSVEVTVSLYGSKTDEKLPASLFRFRKQNNPLNNKKGR